MNKTKRLFLQAIMIAASSISDDIQKSTDEGRNIERAKAIKILAEAYKIVRGRKV